MRNHRRAEIRTITRVLRSRRLQSRSKDFHARTEQNASVAQMASKLTKRPIRVSEALEKGVEGLLDFLARLLNTMWMMSSQPRSAFKLLMLDRHAAKPRFIMPFTYAAIGMFLLSVVTKAADANILNWMWMGKEIGHNIGQRLTTEISMVSVAIGAIPALIGLFALSYIEALMLRLNPVLRYRLLLANCYAIGTQAIYLFLFAALVTFGDVGIPGAGELKRVPNGGLAYAWGVLLFVFPLLAIVLVPTFLLHSVKWRGNAVKRAWHPLATSVIVLLSICGLLLYPALAEIPNAARRFATASEPASISQFGYARFTWNNGALLMDADVLISNPTDSWLRVAPHSFSALVEFDDLRAGAAPRKAGKRDVKSMELRNMMDETGRIVYFTPVAPKSLTWRRLKMSAQAPDKSGTLSILGGNANPCIKFSFTSDAKDISSECRHGTIRVE